MYGRVAADGPTDEMVGGIGGLSRNVMQEFAELHTSGGVGGGSSRAGSEGCRV
jgi:hypothetical protein